MCRGTTNGEEIYIIPFKSIPEKNRESFLEMIPNIIKNNGGIPVDKCIGQEVEALIKRGVITLGCCCGHGKYAPSCLIDESSIQLAKKLGYRVKFEIDLKSGSMADRA